MSTVIPLCTVFMMAEAERSSMGGQVHQGRVPEKLAGHHQYSGSWLNTVPFGHR